MAGISGVIMANAHQWVHRVENTPATPLMVKRYQYAQLTQAIIEIQNVISHMDGGDGEGGELAPDAVGVEDYKVYQAQGGVAVWDYVRATA